MNEERVQVSWLGQAGFSVTSAGGALAIDPYLSNACSRLYGLDREMEPPVKPAFLGVSYVLVSHWHEDHLDVDSAVEFASSGARFVAPPSCVSRLEDLGINNSLAIISGNQLDLGWAKVTAVPALHVVPEALTEDAVGYLIDIDGVRIYHSGDSEYDRSMLSALNEGPLALALLCVNGTGGNMNAWEAAALAVQLNPRLVVPMHFGMWSAAGYGSDGTLDPSLFLEAYGRLSPGARVALPEIGAAFVLQK